MQNTAIPLRADILQEALDATMKSRNSAYGEPYANLQLAGKFKELYHKHVPAGKYCQAHDEAIELVLTKLARIATGAADQRDTYVDAAAYMAIAAEVQAVHNKVTQAVEMQSALPFPEPDVIYKPAANPWPAPKGYAHVEVGRPFALETGAAFLDLKGRLWIVTRELKGATFKAAEPDVNGEVDPARAEFMTPRAIAYPLVKLNLP